MEKQDRMPEITIILGDEAPPLGVEEGHEQTLEALGSALMELADEGVETVPMVMMLWDTAECRETLRAYMENKASPLWQFVGGDDFSNCRSYKDTLQ